MMEMRHGLNNALTSLLGNSDLLLIEPGSLSAQSRGQIETIRNMTLRIHEVMQRFSSLEKEMNVVAQQVERDSGKARARGCRRMKMMNLSCGRQPSSSTAYDLNKNFRCGNHF